LFFALQLMNGMDTDDVSLLPDVHATSSGLKAFCTWATHYGIDTCRQACGGHGYSSYSRLPQLFADFAVMCTWEGDNTVMALQTSRYLIKCLERAKGISKKRTTVAMKTPEPLQGSVRYLVDRIPARCGATHMEGMLDANTLLSALRWRARTAVVQCNSALEACRSKGMSDGEAWNATAVSLVAASRAHVYLNIAAFFAVAVARRGILEQEAGIITTASTQQAGSVVDPLTGKRVDETPFTRVTGVDAAAGEGAKRAVAGLGKGGKRGRLVIGAVASADAEVVATPLYPVLKRLCDLFIVHHIQGDMAFYLRHGYFTSEHANWIDVLFNSLLTELRPDALALSDAFDLPDFIINSPMAKADGDVYRAYMDRVKKVPEATQSKDEAAASGGEVHASRAPYFNSLLKPLFEGAILMKAVEEAEVSTKAADLSDEEWAAYATSIHLYDSTKA
jgi:acyl-CoA oxidase